MGAGHAGPPGQPRRRAADIFAVLREGDMLVHHPYDGVLGDDVEEFIRQAAADPKVLAIKLTLYRTSGDSPIVKALIRAAERGKQVAALVELKARFDEQGNIEWAQASWRRRASTSSTASSGLKIHTKTTLVVRDEPDGIRRYCHIGTGNYNSKTAKLYRVVSPGRGFLLFFLEVPVALGRRLRRCLRDHVGRVLFCGPGRARSGPNDHGEKAKRDEKALSPGVRHRLGGAGGVRNVRATRRELFRMALTALDIVMVARETASTSSPSLNGSRTSLPLNWAAKAGGSMEKSP